MGERESEKKKRKKKAYASLSSHPSLVTLPGSNTVLSDRLNAPLNSTTTRPLANCGSKCGYDLLGHIVYTRIFKKVTM